MKASKEYTQELRSHQESLRHDFPTAERLNEMLTQEAELRGMTLLRLLHPIGLVQALRDKRPTRNGCYSSGITSR